jgi:hypothetical protein
VRLFLDNCLDWRVGRLLTGHQVSHAKDLGWENLENGRLLSAAAEAGFDALITVDKKMRSQQNLDALPVSVLEIDSPDSRLPEVQRLVPFILAALPDCRRFRFISVDKNGNVERLGERT